MSIFDTSVPTVAVLNDLFDVLTLDNCSQESSRCAKELDFYKRSRFILTSSERLRQDVFKKVSLDDTRVFAISTIWPSGALSELSEDINYVKEFDWDTAAQNTLEILENLLGTSQSSKSCNQQRCYLNNEVIVADLIQNVARISGGDISESEMRTFSKLIVKNFAPRNIKKKIILDISILHLNDDRTGIQRVNRALLVSLLCRHNKDYDIILVYFDFIKKQYYLPFEFYYKISGKFSSLDFKDIEVNYYLGDIYVGLDILLDDIDIYDSMYREMQCNGVTINYFLHNFSVFL
ncbi:hypothetical protein [Candidatus Desulfovibrio trichonymphae]|uniref:hypothetical protein n=1 Tax=Candidatus Desulfovibrio trichonymphae TaxID=1725232 RepID=UPI0011AB6FEB|nr:hypothetical protein [Candidatus Desulfovibrio trichonymphae]